VTHFRQAIRELAAAHQFTELGMVNRCGLPRSSWQRFMTSSWIGLNHLQAVIERLPSSPAEKRALVEAYLKDLLELLRCDGFQILAPGEIADNRVIVDPDHLATFSVLAQHISADPALTKLIEGLAETLLRRDGMVADGFAAGKRAALAADPAAPYGRAAHRAAASQDYLAEIHGALSDESGASQADSQAT